jgi:hypothetical protein
MYCYSQTVPRPVSNTNIICSCYVLCKWIITDADIIPTIVVSLNTAIPIKLSVVLLRYYTLPLYYMIVLFVRLNCPSLNYIRTLIKNR